MKVVFPCDVYKKLRAYVKAVSTEISGLGKIRVEGDKIIVEEIRIFDQIVTEGDTIMHLDALTKFYDEAMQRKEDLGPWKLWWHSHGELYDAFFSAKDQATIEDEDNESEKDNWLLSLVTNSAGQVRIRADVFYPIRCTQENIPWEISHEDNELEEQIKKEVMGKIKLRKKDRPVKIITDKSEVLNTSTAIDPTNYQPQVLYNKRGQPLLLPSGSNLAEITRRKPTQIVDILKGKKKLVN